MSEAIIFFGNERLATGTGTDCPALRGLIDAGYEIAAIVVAQHGGGKSRRPRKLEVEELAEKHGITLIAPADLRSVRDELASYCAQAAVLIAYGKIVPPEVLEIFPRGIINIHPSLLPLHRGSSPIETVILEGAGKTGVSLMKLVEKMDAGPLYDQMEVPLGGGETKQELADKLSGIGKDMLLEHLPGILDGSAEPEAQESQDGPAPTYAGHIAKTDGRIEWEKPAVRLEREIRAYHGWPRSHARLGQTDVVITAVRACEGSGRPGELLIEGKELGVYCGEGVLMIDSLVPSGRREMSAEAFLAGHKLM